MEGAKDQRAVIYVDLDSEVTTIFEQVRKAASRKVLIVIPARAMILQSLVSLKILRFKSEHAGKAITIVTKDAAGRELALEAGLAAATSVTLKKGKTKAREPLDSARGKQRTEIKRRKLKIVEVVSRAKEKFQQLSRDDIPLARINPVTGVRKAWGRLAGTVGSVELAEDGSEGQLVVRAPSRKLLFLLLTGAAALLFFIVYIAVPTATIYVTPRADPLSKVVNVTFTNQVASSGPVSPESSAHTVPAEIFDFNFSRDIRIGATGRVFEGTNARGTITVFNRSPKEKFIVPSRFMNQEGLIFHTVKALTIPKAIGDIPGSIIAEVEACEMDDSDCDCINEPDTCEGDFIGERGNVDPSFFKLPAIPALSPSLYWGESQRAFTGGVTKVTKFISAEDTASIEETVVREIEQLAKQEILVLLEQKNKLESRTLALLDDRQTVKVELLTIDTPANLVGTFQDDFVVVATARVQAIAYEQDDLRELLFSQLETKVHPDKALVKIKFDGTAFRVENANLLSGSVKVSATVEGIEEYDLSTETEAGTRLTEKIRNRILGRRVGESEAYIRNLPEVSNAIISSWPFWARNIPELTENVKFRVKR